MTSPELIRELHESRPAATPALRARVQEIAARDATVRGRLRFRLPLRQRRALIALPVVAGLAIAIAVAGVVGLTHSSGTLNTQGRRTPSPSSPATHAPARTALPPTPSGATTDESAQVAGSGAAHGVFSNVTPQPTGISPTPGRAQSVAATLTVQVPDSDGVSRAAQQALVVTRSLGGHVVDASVETGSDANASLTVRVPTASVQEAIVRLSALGRIVSQQVTISDLQESLDTLARRGTSARTQIAHITALLQSPTLDPVTRATLEARRRALRAELRSLRTRIAATNAQARLATIQMTVGTPAALGIVVTPSKLDRAIDNALEVLAWEGIVLLAILLVAAPLALLGLAVWLARRVARRREDERLLAAS